MRAFPAASTLGHPPSGSCAAVGRRAHRAADNSFGRLLRRALPAVAWHRLHAQIRRRFDQAAPHFTGRMRIVHCSLLGRVLATLLAPARLLPDRCARDVGFDFGISAADGGLHKRRRYHWSDGGCFEFWSRVGEVPRLHEQFACGLGMYLRLSVVDDGALLFADDGYFMRLGSLRVRLPAWLPGRFELLHRNVDARRFHVQLRVSNVLFGTLFYQCGEFAASD